MSLQAQKPKLPERIPFEGVGLTADSLSSLHLLVENAAAQDVLEPMSPCTPPSRAVAGSSVELTPEPLSRRVVSLATHWVGGVGPPRLTYALGKPRQFHDGAGLTSPGRWDKKDRIFPLGHGWNALRAGLEKELSRTFGDGLDRLPFRCACGGGIASHWAKYADLDSVGRRDTCRSGHNGGGDKSNGQ